MKLRETSWVNLGRLEYNMLQLDIGLPEVLKQTTVSLNTWSPSGLCAQPPTVHTVHPWLHSKIPSELYNEVLYEDNGTSWGCTTNTDDSSYRKEINMLAEWSTENTLLLNTSEAKELSVEFWKKAANRNSPVYISGAEVKQMNNFRFFWITITENPSWSLLLHYLGYENSTRPPWHKSNQTKFCCWNPRTVKSDKYMYFLPSTNIISCVFWENKMISISGEDGGDGGFERVFQLLLKSPFQQSRNQWKVLSSVHFSGPHNNISQCTNIFLGEVWTFSSRVNDDLTV